MSGHDRFEIALWSDRLGCWYSTLTMPDGETWVCGVSQDATLADVLDALRARLEEAEA